MTRVRQELDAEIGRRIIASYRSGARFIEMARMFGKSPNTIRAFLVDAGAHVVTPNPLGQKPRNPNGANDKTPLARLVDASKDGSITLVGNFDTRDIAWFERSFGPHRILSRPTTRNPDAEGNSAGAQGASR